MGYADTAGQVSPCGCHSRQALRPMKMDHLSHLQPTVLSGGAGDIPHVAQLQVFCQLDEIGFFAVPLHCPTFDVGVSCHRERVERAVLTVRKGVLAIVQAPFPGRLAPASGDSPQTTHLLGKSVENGSVLGSECVCQVTAPQASIPWLS